MSLFKTREWWSLDSSNPEIYSPDAFKVARFKKLTGRESDLILTGSLSGNIRIFNPYPVHTEGSEQTFGPENLILEMNLGKPILHIATGRLSRFASFKAILLVLELGQSKSQSNHLSLLFLIMTGQVVQLSATPLQI